MYDEEVKAMKMEAMCRHWERVALWLASSAGMDAYCDLAEGVMRAEGMHGMSIDPSELYTQWLSRAIIVTAEGGMRVKEAHQ